MLAQPHRVRAVFLDAVGTLLHPVPPAADVYAEVADRLGLHLRHDTITARFQAQFQQQETLDCSLNWRTNEAREVERWQRIVAGVFPELDNSARAFTELWGHFSRPGAWEVYPDVMGCLEQLKGRGLVLGIASNFDQRLRSVLAGLPDLTACVHLAISSEIGWRKPAAGFFAALPRLCECLPAEILFVGDDLHNDYEGASAAGLQAILLERAGRSRERSKLTTLAALPALLEHGPVA